MGKVWIVGAGPGDPDLITVKGRDLIARADAILYAGSLVPKATMRWAPEGCEIADSKGMALEAITAWLVEKAREHATVVRLQTGDPTLFGALSEIMRPLDAAGIEIGVVSGVSSAMAAAATAMESLTLPEVTQSVIFSRIDGRTPMPEGESLAELASHHCTLCLFLSITLLRKMREGLLAAGWAEDSPVLVVQKAGWPGEERIVRGTLEEIEKRCRMEKITSQAMIIVSPALGARTRSGLKKSKLYDRGFGHRFRQANRQTAS